MDLYYFVSNAPELIQKSFLHRKHGKGSSILYPGEENNYLYILVNGSANVVVQHSSGAGIILYTYEAYSCFGELELFHKNAKTFDVISNTDCETLILHKDLVFEWMKQDFEFTKYLIEQLAEKLLKNSNKLTSVSLLSVKDRLLYCIYTHQQLGDLSTLTKEAVCTETVIPLRSLNRAVVECTAEQFIDFKKKHFHIINRAKLEEYCSSMI